MNCVGYPSTERLMGSIYDLLCCVVLLCFAALKTWVIYSWTFALGTVVFFLYCQLRLFSFLLVGACYFVLCLAPFYVCIGFFGGFLPSTGLGLLRCAVQLLLFWLVLLLLTVMGFPGAVIFAAPSLVPTPVCTVSLVDVAMRVSFPAVLVAVSFSMHVVFSLATQIQFPVMPAHAAARVLFRAPALIAPVAFTTSFLATQVPFPVMPVGILSRPSCNSDLDLASAFLCFCGGYFYSNVLPALVSSPRVCVFVALALFLVLTFTRVDFAEQTGSFAVSEADVSVSVLAASSYVLASLSAALETVFNAVDFGVWTVLFAVPRVGLSAHHTVPFPVAVASFALVLVRRLIRVQYLTADMLYRVLVPCLGSFEILFSNKILLGLRNAVNKWGVFVVWLHGLTALVCSDSFSIRPRGGVSVSELSVNWCERTLTSPRIVLRRDRNCNDAVEEVCEKFWNKNNLCLTMPNVNSLPLIYPR